MICVVVGTRPEIIKMAPVIRALSKHGLAFEIIHSNQHYSASMDQVFFTQLNLPPAAHNLGIGSGSQAEQTAKMMIAFEKYCQENQPDLVLVHGDTNTALGATLAAKKMLIPVGHVEAGLRSRDETMPEEVNRVIVDRLSTLLFAPTASSRQNMLSEGIASGKIFVTGNTIVDAVNQHMPLAKQHSKQLLKQFKVESGEYILVTAHRPSNVDQEPSLRQLIELVTSLAGQFQKKILWPVHPRTKQNIEKFSISPTASITFIEPTAYLEMLYLIQHAFLVATDSGGVQEEAYILRRPLITLRENTERPETLTANFLVGGNSQKASTAVEQFLHNHVTWNQDLGDGHAAEQIVTQCARFLGKRVT